MSKVTKVTKSGGNVFADLGLPNAKELAVKADLVVQIQKIMREEALTQTEAAHRIGISQGDLSRLLRGHFRGHSVDRLMTALTRLGQDVTIGVRPAKKKTGRVAVELANA